MIKMKICDRCKGFGYIIVQVKDTCVLSNKATKCQKCSGTGVIDEYRLMRVPLKYVKDEFWDETI